MSMKVDVVTIERKVYSVDDATMINIPGLEGNMGILPRHSPMVTALRQGLVEIVRGDERDVIAVGGGFAQVRGTEVVVMADVAEKADEIDEARAQEARQRAQAALENATEKQDMEKALAAMRRADVRMRAAKKSSRRARQ